MKFECGDLERALASGDLMQEAREHLKSCALCRREYRLWNEISASARSLHEEWETPSLWRAIRSDIEAEPKPGVAFWRRTRIWSIAAALVVAAGLWFLLRTRFEPDDKKPDPVTAAKQDFLTDQALSEVEKNEAAYRRSIAKLARLAQPKLSANSPASANTREKLLLLDSEIEDTRANVRDNRFNTRLQLTLAGLYREKQQTLQDVITRDKNN